MLKRGSSPAACQVEPAVNSVRSSKATSFQPFLVRWYRVLTPTTPPPMTNTRTWVFTGILRKNSGELAGRFGQEACYVVGERPPDLNMERMRTGAPQDDVRFAEHRARAHSHREG